MREIRTETTTPVPVTLDGRTYGYSQSSSKLYESKLTPNVTNDDHVFEHDALDRLMEIQQGDFNETTATFAGTPLSEALGFDGAGSIRNHTLASGQSHSNATDSTNAYVGTFDGITASHDDRGNVSELGLMNLVYDVFGHLVATIRPYESPVVPTWEVRDAFDRRVYREVSSQKRAFVWNGEQLFQEVNVTSAPTSFSVDREYIHGPGQDFVVAQRIGGSNRAFHVDEMGSPYCATTPAGSVAERYDMDPYGAVNATDVDGGGLLGNRVAMAGQWWDSVTNLYYMRARHYSPVLKRFLARDPVGVWGDVLNVGNAYVYAGMRVTWRCDPHGLTSSGSGLLEEVGEAVKSIGKAVGSVLKEQGPRIAKEAAKKVGTRAVVAAEASAAAGPAAAAAAGPVLTGLALAGAVQIALDVGSAVSDEMDMQRFMSEGKTAVETSAQKTEQEKRAQIAKDLEDGALKVYRIGAHNAENFTPRESDLAAKAPGLSVQIAPTPQAAADLFRATLNPHQNKLYEKSLQVSEASVPFLRGNGFSVIPTPSNNNPLHATVNRTDGSPRGAWPAATVERCLNTFRGPIATPPGGVGL
ncbi:MAG: RHS repeat-associated core domain-containing protein [Planctomycetes bacterium]|nr:RHS repeat-associated core domain-containing protein [Planctomycetota bacterium]